LVTSATGSVVSQHSYWPFGEEMTVTSSPERMRFAGHERDALSSLDSMHARFYAPWGGRFLSVDPGRDYDFHKPQSFNLYAYVRNNPVTWLDPTGRELNLFFDFSGSGIPTQLQLKIAAGVRQRFVNAGVNEVSAYFYGGSIKPSFFSQAGNVSVILKFVSRDLGPGVFGVTPRAPYPGTRRWPSTTSLVTTRPRTGNEDAAVVKMGAVALLNYAINVATHEAGHGSGALNQYAADSLKNTAESGSVMETHVPLQELLLTIREFSLEDAQSLAKHLNNITSETNVVKGEEADNK
ncbi:MAG: RHS repeat-associated core domain-containing protein, partial [Candidatus Hadarchaeum sp.]